MKLLVDMNLSARWSRLLSEEGIEAKHWTQIGLPDAPDQEIMAFAAAHRYVIVTKDLDYGAMLAASRSGKPSVVQLRLGVLTPHPVLLARLSRILRESEAELEAGALLTVDPERVRRKILPFTPEYPASF